MIKFISTLTFMASVAERAQAAIADTYVAEITEYVAE